MKYCNTEVYVGCADDLCMLTKYIIPELTVDHLDWSPVYKKRNEYSAQLIDALKIAQFMRMREEIKRAAAEYINKKYNCSYNWNELNLFRLGYGTY